jgi:hypothetical protein
VLKLTLGDRSYDLSTRALVMGILNRTPDSFYDKGAYWDMDAFLTRAAALVASGADLLDVGGVKAGPGPFVDEQAELERVIPAVSALRARFDVPLSVDTWRASVAAAAFAEGAVLGNDISGFSDPLYLPAAAAAGATVVAAHIRLAPRVADPTPVYDDVVSEVAGFLEDGPGWPVSIPTGSWWMPGWIWARPGNSRWSCCGPPTGWPASGTRCCCRRPTRPFWATCSTWRWAIGRLRRWPPMHLG